MIETGERPGRAEESTRPAPPAALSRDAATRLGSDRSYDVASFEFDLDSDDAAIGRQFRRTFLPFLAREQASVGHRYEVEAGGNTWRLRYDGKPIYGADTWQHLYAYLEWHVLQTALGGVGRFVALHSAAVCLREGALLLSGPSGAGKSTLTLELLRRGAGFMSDEAVLLSAQDGKVRGVPRAIVLKDPGSMGCPSGSAQDSIPERIYCYPWEASVEVVTDSAKAAAVVLLVHTGVPTKLERIAGSQAFPYLLEQTFASSRNPMVLDAVATLLQHTPAYTLTVDRVEDAAELLTGLQGSLASR